MKKKRVKQLIVLVASLAATAAINYSLLNTPFVFIILFVLLSHELAHYIVSSMNNGDPDLPYFIPVPFMPIGVTRIRNIRNLSANSKRLIYFYGPFVGFLVSLFLSILSFVYIPQYAIPLLFVAAAEIVFNYFGSDGKKYRLYNN